MTRHRPVLTALLFGALLALPAAAQPVGINWRPDIESAKKQARESNRLVLVHFWTQTCGPCKMLEQNVFNQAGVGTAIEAQFVPVKLNADENSATAAGFGITRVPTDIIITPDGEVVGRLISPPTPSAYVAELSQVSSKYASRLGQSFAQAAAAAPVLAYNDRVNSAYANLAVGAGAALAGAPAAPEMTMAVPPDRYSPTGFAGAGQWPANAAAPSVPIQPPAAPPMAAPQSAYAALLSQQPQPNHYGASAPTSAVPAAAMQPMAPSQLAAPPLAPPQITPPAIVGNRYAQPSSMDSATSSFAPAPVATPAPSQVANPYTVAPPQLPAAAAPIAPYSAPFAAPPGVPPTAPSAVTEQPPAVPPVAASAAQDSRKLPTGAPPLGFDGYCPVSMRKQWKWVPGNPQYGIIHRGRTYWFAGPEEQKQFWENPDHFSPALSGLDPVLAIDHKQQVSGKREHSLDYDNLFYLFSSEATLQQFAANPERYATGVRQAMNIERGRFTR
jgi:YHS domain-containing protein/thiol-disulfide isomerase/thioredoxin